MFNKQRKGVLGKKCVGWGTQVLWPEDGSSFPAPLFVNNGPRSPFPHRAVQPGPLSWYLGVGGPGTEGGCPVRHPEEMWGWPPHLLSLCRTAHKVAGVELLPPEISSPFRFPIAFTG